MSLCYFIFFNESSVIPLKRSAWSPNTADLAKRRKVYKIDKITCQLGFKKAYFWMFS